MKLYLAGKMRGVPYFNRPAFEQATAELRALGHEVFSPAEADLARHGEAVFNDSGDEDEAARYGFSLREALGIDLAWLCHKADGIALLPGWETSKGATAEKAVADALGLIVIHLNPANPA